jgi:ABC-2 type transport system permease protein
MTTSHALTPSPGTRLRRGLTESLVIARRRLEHVRQLPEKLIDVTLQPLMFVLLFAFVFGGVIHVPAAVTAST